MSKQVSTILITFVTAVVVIAASLTAGTVVRGWVAENVFKQYVAQEVVIANQVAGNLEQEMTSVKDKLAVAALVPAIQTIDANCNAKLSELFGVLGSKVGNLGRINAQGVFACSVNKALIGLPGKQLGSYVTDIFNDPKHEPVLSHTILPPGATYAVAMHVPVWNAKKQFDGTLGGAVYLRDLEEKFLKNVKFASHGFAILFDENGDILFHPKRELIGKNLTSPEARKVFSNIEGLQRAIAEAKAGRTGSVRYELEGVEKVAAYRSAAVAANRHWVVMATVPVEDANVVLREVGVDQAYWMASGITSLAILLVAFVVVIGTLRSIRLQEVLRQEKTALALEKAKAQTLLSSIGDGVVAIDRAWRIVAFNRAAETITGWTAAEALGRPLREVMKLIKERTRKEDIAFIEDTMLYGKVHHMAANTLLVRRDGSDVPVGDSAAPIFDETGAVTGAVIVFRDISEEKKLPE